MKIIAAIVVALSLTACEPQFQPFYECVKVTEVLACTNDHQEVRGGGLVYEGIGGASVKSVNVPGKCRVAFSNGKRDTLEAPVAVGDDYRWRYRTKIMKDGKRVREESGVMRWDRSCG